MLKKKIHQFFLAMWYRPKPNLTANLLKPLSFVYRLAAKLHTALVKNTEASLFSVPIIVVGNLTVGGTGKTPFVIALTKLLQDKGMRVGIASRGYGGRSKHYPLLIEETTRSEQAGEEPLLLFRHTQASVVVAPKRIDAVSYLVEQSHCDIVICDDGLQHYALARDYEILIVDAERQFGNCLMLPAGPLREPLERKEKVDLVIYQDNGLSYEYSFFQKPKQFRSVNQKDNETRKFSFFNRKKVHVVTAIGNPGRFIRALNDFGIQCIEHSYPDHHFFKEEELLFDDHLPVIMTEKDAIKCMQYSLNDHWYLEVETVLSDLLKEKLNYIEKESAHHE